MVGSSHTSVSQWRIPPLIEAAKVRRYIIPFLISVAVYSLQSPPDYILEQYRIDTGDLWKPAKTPIDEMIDHATGREEAFVRAFVIWANVNIWGSLTKR